MARHMKPEEILINAVISKQASVRVEKVLGSAEKLFRNAFDTEPRILAYISGYETSFMKNGLVQMMYDYDVSLHYQDSIPDRLDDVVLDNGSWEVIEILTKGMPKSVKIVTKNPERIDRDMRKHMGQLLSGYEGIRGFHISSLSFERLTDYNVTEITFDYILSVPSLRQYQSKAVFTARNIWRDILGRSSVPQFVKPFLAFSWLSQECVYDQRTFDEVEADPERVPSDPIPHLAYGPLCEHRGICGGFAWAFKTLMDLQNIECNIIVGFLKEDRSVRHAWCLVKIDGQYYHVDPTWGSKNEGVYVEEYMIPDQLCRATHEWNEEDYPSARGIRFDYDFVEEYLADNGQDYIDDGANEKYFWPDLIID